MTDEKNPSGMPDEDLVGQQKEQVVKYETYQKTVAQEKAAKERLKVAEETTAELKAKLDAIERERQEAEERKLNEKGEHLKIAELRKQEADKAKMEAEEFRSRAAELEKRIEDTEKLQAVYSKIPGKIKNPEYLRFVDIDSIVLDPETGKIDEGSLENVVGSFMEKHSSLIEFNKFKGLPSDAPSGSTRKFTEQEWRSLSLKDKKSNWSRRPQL